MSEAWWDKAPCEAWHGTEQPGSLAWSQQIMAQRYFVQPHIIKFADFIRWGGKQVLEIGCGIGTDAIEFALAGASVAAIDDSQESIRLAEKRVDWYTTGKPKFYKGNSEEWLPFASYDLIYSFGVLHHTLHPEKVLLRAHDVLKDTGQLRIMLYAKYSWKNFWGIQPEAAPGCPHVKWYSKREARKLLESCGFKVVSIRKTHIFPWRIREYRMHLYKKAFPWSVTPQWLFRWLEQRIGHHILLIAKKA